MKAAHKNEVLASRIAERMNAAARHDKKEAGLHYYHQTDPRGCALYVSTEPLNAQNYTNGIACSI